MGHKKSIGLRGGPNEYITDISEFVSIEGYKRNSPDVNNPFNLIDSGSITMEGVDFPVMGTDNLGNSQMMTPGNNYQFPGDQVFEIPMAKRGGGLLNKTMECNSCGWEWKAADGGNDVSTCHKCGGSALPKAQAGGARIQAQANREDQAKREFQINRETGDAVVFVESPTIEKRIYDLYNPYAVNENMPSTLKEFQNQFNLGESKLKEIQDKRQLLIKNDKELQSLYKVYRDLQNQKRTDYEIRAKEPGFDRSSFMESPEYKKINDKMDNAGTASNNRRREITKPFDLKYKNETERYGKIINDNQKNFLDNKLNPITRRMDSTFYKEAENLKKVYGKLHPNSNVDIVPIYDNPDLIRDKVSGLNPNDSMYFFGHSGDRLGGIPNQEIATILGDSEAENCYLGSCGFEGRIEPFQKALQGKNLQYRPEGSWWGVNPGGSSIEDAMWSRVDIWDGNEGSGTGAKVIKPTLGKDYNQLQRGGEQPKAQEGTEVEEKSVWGLVKEMAKVPGANISNLLGVMGIPANLISEATESFTGRGDGEFNFMDAIPSFATPGSDDEIFTFTNQNGTPVKNVAGLEDADGNPLVENPVGAFITNLATDPSTYVGAGVAKNLTKKIPKLFSKQIDNFKFKNLPTVDKKQFMKVVDGEFDTIDYDHLIPTTQEISDLATKTRSRLLSGKFIKNNMEATGRSKDEVVSYIDDYIKEFENSTLAFDKTRGGSAGIYTRGKITIDPRNPNLTRENVLGTLEHEIEHMFSNVGQQGSDLYRHPKFKLVDATGMPNESLVQNMGQAFEQQVRFRKALGWLEKNAGLKVGDDVTDKQVEALTDAIANWSKEGGKDFRGSGANFDIQHLFSNLDAEQFLKPGQFLMPNAPRAANLKNSNVRQGIKDILNKTYAVGAVGGLGAASQMGPKQEDGQYAYGGSLSKLYQDGGEQPKTWKDIKINKDGLKRAIAEVESINGVLMINPESTATGLYGQRFSELEEGKLYKGTRDEFAKDLEAQNRIFDMRLNEGIKSNRTTPLLKDAFDLTNEYKNQLGDKWNYSYEDIIALSNFLGRGGTREFLGNVIRDGKTLEEVYPTKFGKGAKQANKTPYEYLEKTRGYYQKGGSTTNPYTIYMNYINGIDESEVAQNLYDKLNRVHYKDAKKANMSSPNYIMSHIYKA